MVTHILGPNINRVTVKLIFRLTYFSVVPSYVGELSDTNLILREDLL